MQVVGESLEVATRGVSTQEYLDNVAHVAEQADRVAARELAHVIKPNRELNSSTISILFQIALNVLIWDMERAQMVVTL